jgi:hypothetical protein
MQLQRRKIQTKCSRSKYRLFFARLFPFSPNSFPTPTQPSPSRAAGGPACAGGPLRLPHHREHGAPSPSVTCSLRRVRVGPRTRRRRRFKCAGGSSCPTKVGHDTAAHPKPASSQTRARLLDSSKARTRPLDETDSRPPASDPWRRPSLWPPGPVATRPTEPEVT